MTGFATLCLSLFGHVSESAPSVFRLITVSIHGNYYLFHNDVHYDLLSDRVGVEHTQANTLSVVLCQTPMSLFQK